MLIFDLRFAVRDLGVKRIGHGLAVKYLKGEDVDKLAEDKDVTFEVRVILSHMSHIHLRKKGCVPV